MLLDLDVQELAWVLDYVAETEPAYEFNDCVVRAARRLISQLGDQLPAPLMHALSEGVERPMRSSKAHALWCPAVDRKRSSAVDDGSLPNS